MTHNQATQNAPTACCLVTATPPPQFCPAPRPSTHTHLSSRSRPPRAHGGDVRERDASGGQTAPALQTSGSPDCHGFCCGGPRETGRGCVTAPGRAAAARDEAAAASATAVGRRASVAAVPSAEASVTGPREGGGELLLFTFGSQHHQMVRAQGRTRLPLSLRVSELQRSRCSRYAPILQVGRLTQRVKRPFSRPHRIVSCVQQTLGAQSCQTS